MNFSSNFITQIYGVGGFEWIIIIILFIALIFGGKKIPELARTFGKASAEFERARIEAKRGVEMIKNQDISPDREKLEKIAKTLGIDYLTKTDEELRRAIELEINKTKK
jgi:sec-independent protein translocase protein TatA